MSERPFHEILKAKATTGKAISPYSFSTHPSSSKEPISLHLWLRVKRVEKLHLIVATHGAGGTSLSAACDHLCSGIASASSPQTPLAVLAFDGSTNLKARTKAFIEVIEYASKSEQVAQITLAGRSMGCRAAALAYAQSGDSKLSDRLILESYPLIGKDKDARLQPLSDLPEEARILFMQGGSDQMCPRDQLLKAIKENIKATCSTFFVSSADHGMSIRGTYAKSGGGRAATKEGVTKAMGTRAGQLAGDWLSLPEQPTIENLPGAVTWERVEGSTGADVRGEVRWSGWTKPWPDCGYTSAQERGPAGDNEEAEPSRKRARND